MPTRRCRKSAVIRRSAPSGGKKQLRARARDGSGRAGVVALTTKRMGAGKAVMHIRGYWF
jgi:hypothetical protein